MNNEIEQKAAKSAKAESDTPRTDAKVERHKLTQLNGCDLIFADFARQLERELAAAIAERDAAELKLAHAQHDAFYFEKYMNEARVCLREAMDYCEATTGERGELVGCAVPYDKLARWRKAAEIPETGK